MLGRIWEHYRDRLRRVVRLRLDRRLQGRADPSDVLQEAFLDFQSRAAEYAQKPDMPFFLWLHFLTGQRLQLIHRHHLGTQMHDAGREVSLHRGAMPQATSVSLAAQLLGRFTSVTQAVQRAEMQLILQEAINGSTRSTAKSWLCGISRSSPTTRPPRCSASSPRPPAIGTFARSKRLREVLRGHPGVL